MASRLQSKVCVLQAAVPWLDPTDRETSGTSGLEATALCILYWCTELGGALKCDS